MRNNSVWALHSSKIIEMRRSGYTLREIGESVGVSRERIRQLLQENHVSVDIMLLSEKRMAKIIGCPFHQIAKLRKQDIIKPRNHGKFHHHYDYQMVDLEKLKLALQEEDISPSS
jgi:hypothetical protein